VVLWWCCGGVVLVLKGTGIWICGAEGFVAFVFCVEGFVELWWCCCIFVGDLWFCGGVVVVLWWCCVGVAVVV